MKKFGLFLLAFSMALGMAGCGDDDFSPNTTNMAGVYRLTKVTGTQGGITYVYGYPDVWGKWNLTSAGTYTYDISLLGERDRSSGTYAISGDTIIFDGDAQLSGPIKDNGHVFDIVLTEDGATATFEFTRI